MRAAYVEFQLESATMNTREFYASHQGTHRYLTKEAVACAITYNEVLARDKLEQWATLQLDFDCTPAMPIDVRTAETVYKAGDRADVGLLRFGRQELLMPGSTFRFVAWGDIPDLWEGQVILIGKKRAAACITRCLEEDVQPDTYAPAARVMPIQVLPSEVVTYGAFVPLVLTARYAIIRVTLPPGRPRFTVGGWSVPLGV